MGENQGIEMILGKLVELLTEKKNESQSSSSSKENMPHSEVVQKLELMPNDIKLEGIRNYLAWSRRALLLLKAKKLEGLETLARFAAPSLEWTSLFRFVCYNLN